MTKKVKHTINNALELGEDITHETYGKGRKFVSRFIEPGLMYYDDYGDLLITKEALDKFIHTMIGCPVIIEHTDIYDSNADEERVGVVSNVWFNPDDCWFWCEGIIWQKEAIDLVKNQGWSVSCAFASQDAPATGIYHAKTYDMELVDGVFLHLALVDCPRYEKAHIAINSKQEIKSLYIPQAQRLEEGNKY